MLTFTSEMALNDLVNPNHGTDVSGFQELWFKVINYWIWANVAVILLSNKSPGQTNTAGITRTACDIGFEN